MRATLRKSTLAIVAFGLGAAMVLAVMLHARARYASMQKDVRLRAEMVAALGLSDLCIFTEARYTRHPSTADLHTAFQDHPLSLEHFPSGSFMEPPLAVRASYPRAYRGEADGAP